MLKLINVTKRFSKKEVIHPLNYSFTNGVYGLLGPNGAGKTTLINMLAAVSRPSSGQICYNDSDIFQENQAYYDDLGFLPQQDAIYPNMKAKDYLFYLAALKGCICNTWEAHGGRNNWSLVLIGSCRCSCNPDDPDNKNANLGLAHDKPQIIFNHSC